MLLPFKYFKSYRKEVILGPLFKLLEACFELITPLVIANIIDTIIPSSNQGDLVAMILVLVLLAGIGVGVALIAQYFSAKAAVGYTKELSKELFEKILSFPKSVQDSLSNATLFTRMTSDILQIQTGINSFLRLFLRAPIVVFGSFIMAYLISPSLSILFFWMIAILFGIIFFLSKWTSSLYARMRQTLERLVLQIRESFLGMRVIRTFGQQEREITAFSNENQSYQRQQINASFWSSALTPITYLVVNVTLLILIWQGSPLVRMGQLEQGLLVALINYLLQILVELVKLVTIINTMNQTFISSKRIEELFCQPSEDVTIALQQEMTEDLSLVLVAEDVVFSYEGAHDTALKKISLQVHQGETLGIIGGTGAGKSTFVQLLLGLYPVSHGNLQIFDSGKSPKNMEEWRSLFAIVPQQAQLFSGTIRTNLLLGVRGAVLSDDKLWEALEIAQARSFVQEKGGLDAIVETFGRNFSGGQRQRLTIARALLQEKPILLLDDATSALDYLTEKRLLQAIRAERPHQTLLMVSQRISSLEGAHQILVLEKGRQVGLGKHETLLKECAVYQEIYQSQGGFHET